MNYQNLWGTAKAMLRGNSFTNIFQEEEIEKH